MPGSKLGYFNSVLTDKGIPLAATITVFDQGTATPSTIYADAGGVTPLANPFSTDAIGRFQFFAGLGNYDVQVTGPGITSHKIENIRLSDVTQISQLMDVTTYFCVTPEQYGAKGDGQTNDWAAFNAMFTALAGSGAPNRKRVVLNPSSYYRISSAKNATNVFEVDVNNIILEGPGMGILTLYYDGPAATNFMKFLNQPGYNTIREMMIKCGPGDSGNTRDLSPVVNIVCWDDTKYTTLDRVELVGCAGKCVTGFQWMSEVRHCIFKWFGAAGLDTIATTAYVVNCYANGGDRKAGIKGFIINAAYGAYTANACDNAEIGYSVEMTDGGQVVIQGCGAEGCKQYLKSSGGVVYLDGFAGNNAGVSGLPDAWIEMDGSAGRLTGFSNTFANTYLLKTTNCPELVLDSMIPKAKILVTDSTATKFQDPVRVAHDYSGDDFRWVEAADFGSHVNVNLRNYIGCQNATAILKDGTKALSSTLVLKNMRGWGRFNIYRQNAWGETKIRFLQTSGNGFELENINLPLSFYGHDNANIHLVFQQEGSGVLFKLTNCQLVRFFGVELIASEGRGAVFELDEFSALEIDKTVMDKMNSNFSGLCNKPHRIKFTGYTAKPIAGLFDTGCRIEFMAPAAGGYLGCICTAGGTPGTWKYYGAIEA